MSNKSPQGHLLDLHQLSAPLKNLTSTSYNEYNQQINLDATVKV